MFKIEKSIKKKIIDLIIYKIILIIYKEIS